MLRNILSTLDENLAGETSLSFMEDLESFSREANRLLYGYQPLRDFFNIAEILNGRDTRLGAGAILWLLKDVGKENLWFDRMIRSLNKEFCLANADLVVQEGKRNIGWGFTEKTRDMLDNDFQNLRIAIAHLGMHFGTGFIMGAHLQLELLRRVDENDFGVGLSTQMQ